MKKTVFCPLCKKKYKLKTSSYKTNPYLFALFVSFTMFAFVFFNKIFPLLFFSLFPLMIFIEYGKRLAARFSITCPYCAFDIVTYKKDKVGLVKRINNFHKTKRINLENLLNLGN